MDNAQHFFMFATFLNRLNTNILTICEEEEEIAKELTDFMKRRARVSRRISTVDRHKTFWYKDIKEGSAELFKESCRMDRATFNMLVERMKGMEKSILHFRRTIPLEERVAIALYTLGSSADYKTVGARFGVSKASVCNILHEFCQEVIKKLAPEYLSSAIITQEKIEDCVKGFEALGFPQCYGVIDGCHIEVKLHAKEAVEYRNNKGWYSVVLFALVDYRGRFQYIKVGSPGRCQDSDIYNQSQLKTFVETSELFQRNAKMICGTNVPVLLIGDSAYCFSRSLMKPYPFAINATEEQTAFNNNLSKTRQVVQNAFTHLKARFRRLDKGLGAPQKKTTNIIICCCTLHNFLNNEKVAINEKWQNGLDDKAQPEEINEVHDWDTTAEEIRKAISRHLKENPP